MITKQNAIKIAVIALAIFLAFANPFTRKIVLWLLPLGRGVDDFVEALALLVVVVILVGRGYARWKAMEDYRVVNRKGNTKLKQVVLVVITVLLSLIIPPAGSALWGLFFFAVPITDPTVFVEIAIAAVVAVGGWQIIGYVDRKKGLK